ncbi:MAG: sigma-70 family RNA polymerase sigma factor, partial [Candidatus Saccharimonas sp.]|nr:sigma-70 family RNA polymerase sigma factor [Planctomycetaceae bacterium]
MPQSPIHVVIHHLRSAAERDGAVSTDGELLTRFLSQRDDDALAALVERHAPMVWGVCRRMLRNPHDAEDAFQATFLVLVRKAGAVVPREMVANWLYGVAHQTAVRLRATAAKRGVREMQMIEMPEPAVAEAREDELLLLLDQELSRLPQRFRAIVVLCDLEGKTRKEVAKQLGCPEGTVASRLGAARAMLAKRMSPHGLAVSGGSLAAAFSQSAASAGVPNSVVSSTIHVATLLAANQAVGVISGPVAALTEGVLKTMLLKKIMATTLVVLAVCVAAITGGSLALGQTEGTGKPVDKPPITAEKPIDQPPATAKANSKPEGVKRPQEKEAITVPANAKAEPA